MGTYAELLASSASFRSLLANIHQQEQEQELEHSKNIQRERMSRHVTFSEGENEEEGFLACDSLEMKEEGSVKWHVYMEYLRAGAGLVLGFTFLILLFGLREFATLFHGRWLAQWSEDEGHRHEEFNNCTASESEKMNAIRRMSDDEWNNYRNARFYFYCGLYSLDLYFAV